MKNFTLFFIVLVLAACSQQQPELHLKKIHLKLLDTPKVFLEDIAQEIKMVDLGSPKDTTIKNLTNLFVTDSLIIVGDRSQNAIFTFDKTGKFKNKIKHFGTGAGEYRIMGDVLYDTKQNNIEVIDLWMSKIYTYNTVGKFLTVRDIVGSKYFSFPSAKVGDVYVTLAPRSKSRNPTNRLSVFETRDNMLSYHKPLLTNLPFINKLDIMFPHPLENYKDSLYYLPLLDDKIYNVTLHTAIPKYEITTSENNNISEELNKLPPAKDHFEYWKKMAAAKVMYNVHSLFINDKWIAFNYDYEGMGQSRNVFYSKKTGNVLQFMEYKSHKYPDFRSRNRIIGKDGDYFIMVAPVISPLGSKRKLTQQLNTEKPMHIQKRFSLIFFKLKDF